MSTSVSNPSSVIKLGPVTALVEGPPGTPGSPGNPGPEGKSSFELWLAQSGNSGKTLDDFFEAYRGNGLNNRGQFVMGQSYKMNDYVVAAGSNTDSAIFFCKSPDSFVSTAQPRSDSGHWTELVAPAGANGKSVELRKSDTHLQWRVQDEAEWNDLIALSELKVKGDPGADGKSFSVDASGPTANRSQYDNQALGFSFLDTTTGYLYIHGEGDGVWSDPIPFKGDKGDDGANIEFQKTATYIQWRPVGSTQWFNLVPLSELAGATGKNIELQATTDYIQWRVAGSTTWTNLVQLASLQGKAGTDGATWLSGNTGPSNSAGKVGDFWLNTATGEISKKTGTSAWTIQLTLPTGPSSGGSTWLLTTTDPTTSQGSDGQWALNSAKGTIWNKGGSTWNKVMGIPAFATLDDAVAATDYTLAMSPARVREYMESFGLTAKFTTTLADLNTSVRGEFFNYNADTLHHPGTGGYGRGITIPSGDGYSTQLAIENDSNLMYVRYQTAGAWGTWAAIGGGGGSTTFATNPEALAGQSLTVAMSPGRTREYLESLGLGAKFTTALANLNTAVRFQPWSWNDTTTNTPAAGSYGRGFTLPSGDGYVTQIGIVNDTGKMYIRYQSGASTWSTWTALGGSSGGGASIPAATMPADKTLNASSATAMGFTGSVLPVVGKLYSFKAILLTQGPAGATFSIKMVKLGAQFYRIDVRSPNASGAITSSVSTQSGVAATGCTGAVQDGITVIEGLIHFNYVDTAMPDLTIQLATGDWATILKNSSYTLTPIGDVAL
ncbi:tail fiber protein [Erwinia phage vB_EamP-S6]|uniref:Gp066 n=1 Tax=Erwinia phage vB_EamP-S6 TaxID=1051675 RepID=G0YQF8_9CAUD|nr:tail fiber protein [Erwinia phage vB_EamP-S6]AEJ81585.1 gp066 [Erwinia phage vB_EamP-S6]